MDQTEYLKKIALMRENNEKNSCPATIASLAHYWSIFINAAHIISCYCWLPHQLSHMYPFQDELSQYIRRVCAQV